MNKYRNIKTTVNGITFASKKEAARFVELKILERAGEISHLQIQPNFPLTINGVKIGTYTADFAYHVLASNESVIEDVKSTATKTPIYRLKKKLVKALHAVDIQEV